MTKQLYVISHDATKDSDYENYEKVHISQTVGLSVVSKIRRYRRRVAAVSYFSMGFAMSLINHSFGAENGVSFWLPGTYGSLAAIPEEAGFGFAAIYYHTSVKASGGVNFPRGGGVRVGLDVAGKLSLLAVSYTFDKPVLGAQFTISMMNVIGSVDTGIAATVTGPGGGVVSGVTRDSVKAFGDFFPTATLKWNNGVHNFMLYGTGNLPIGAFRASRLSNIGLGHAAIDGGIGYTYLDASKGREFSAVTGITYNFMNSKTNVKTGTEFHLEIGASQFLTEKLYLGAAGYIYNQIGCDSGRGNISGCFKSRVAGVGPQAGFIFPASDGYQGILSLKLYKEGFAKNRPSGWNAWLALAFSATAKKPVSPMKVRY